MKYSGIFALVFVALFNPLALAQDAFPKAQFVQGVQIDVARQKSTKFDDPGYSDDHEEKLSFTISLLNKSKTGFADVEMKFYLFAQNMYDKKAFKLMQVYSEKFTLEPLKSLKFNSAEVTTRWDNTAAVFGNRYKGWIVRFLAPDGSVLVEKSTSSFFTNTKKLPELKEGAFYDKGFAEVPKPRG